MNEPLDSRLLIRLFALALGGLLLAQALRRPVEGSEAAVQEIDSGNPAGRTADAPWAIPSRGWLAILKRTYREMSDDRVMAVAAGVTFYVLLAIFPAIAAFVSLYGLTLDPATLTDHINTLSGLLPGGAIDIVTEQLRRLTSQPPAALGFGFIAGLVIALWSSNAGMKAMFDALNVVYDEIEKRSFIRLNLISLCFTAGAIVLLVVGLAAIAVVPLVLSYLGLSSVAERLIGFARWPALFVVVALALSVLYRFGPSRAEAKWRWISPGSVLASLLWIIASAAFSWYAANFGSYNETYGTLGAAIGFMTWIWISSAIVLMGAELNAETERQTARDSTTGPPRPMGSRGAVVADTVAP